MPLFIRTFRNTDVDSICNVWNTHFADSGFESRLSPLRLELCCLAKPYFDPAALLIAEADGQVVGFVHLASLPNATFDDVADGTMAISALCVTPHPNETEVATGLLERCGRIAVENSMRELRFKPMLPNCAFYLGFGPADSMIGATSGEHRACSWIQQAGFQPLRPTNQWELELSKFHPPADRLQIQIRRSAHVDRQVDEPMLPWWQACVLGHTEPTAFQLTDRVQRRVLNECLFWTVAPELQSVPASVAWLWPPTIEPTPGSEAAKPGSEAATPASEAATPAASANHRLVFLLAESLREFQTENIDLVRTVSLANDGTASQLLKRLGFKPIQSGVVFSKNL